MPSQQIVNRLLTIERQTGKEAHDRQQGSGRVAVFLSRAPISLDMLWQGGGKNGTASAAPQLLTQVAFATQWLMTYDAQ